jgi:predicted dehydrogenase
LKSGILGRPFTFRGVLLHGSYLNPKRPMSWRLQSELAGAGALLDLGVHLFDLVRVLLGEVCCVQAQLRTFVAQRGNAMGVRQAVTLDDWAQVNLQLTNGVLGSIELSRVHFGLEAAYFTIVCERGTLRIPLDHLQPAEVHLLAPGRAPDLPDTTQGLSAYRPAKKLTEDVLLCCHTTAIAIFLHRLQGGTLAYPVPTFADALAAEQVVAAAQSSAALGRSIRMEHSPLET